MTTTGTAGGWVPSGCTLPTVEQPLRQAEFDEFVRTAVHTSTRITPTRLDLVIAPESEACARDLAKRESACCSFFQFAFEPDAHGGLVMRIGVPDDHIDVLDALHARVSAITATGDQHA